MSRILLTIGFVDSNAASARRTILEFGTYFREHPRAQDDVLLGVHTASRHSSGLAQLASGFSALYVWDGDATLRALKALEGRPRPFASGFSYGGYVNQCLMLSRLTGCDYLLRIDPGTLPPGDLWNLLDRQRAALLSHRVVSGVYQDRLAFRDHLYARRSLRDQYLAFIAQQTGVALHEQLTGGALFMMASPGVPAIPFAQWSSGEPTLVWGSDDAVFQDGEIATRVFAEHKVPRHDPFGKAKPPIEYFRGVAGMVYLHHLRRGDAARLAVASFIDRLNEFLDPSLPENRGSRFPLELDEVVPSRFLDAIDSGYANYLQLLGAWNPLIDDVAREVDADALMLQKS
jgi:hypothetical protein